MIFSQRFQRSAVFVYMLVGDFVIVVVLFVCFCNLLSNDLSMGKILRGGNMGVRGQFLEKRKLCVLTKERKQPPVVILQQAIFYNIFIQWLWLRIIRRSDQGVQIMSFPSHIFLNDIIHGYRVALLKKKFLWVLPFYITEATYCYYGKVLRTMRTAVVSHLLKA